MKVEQGQLWEFDWRDLYYVVRVVDENHVDLLDIDEAKIHDEYPIELFSSDDTRWKRIA